MAAGLISAAAFPALVLCIIPGICSPQALTDAIKHEIVWWIFTWFGNSDPMEKKKKKPF